MSASYSERKPQDFKPSDNDWVCDESGCGNVNFARRSHCNRCGTEKKMGQKIATLAAEMSKGLFIAVDWQCDQCGNVNWARRSTCNVCNGPKDGEVEERNGLGGGSNEKGIVEEEEYDVCGRNKKSGGKVNWVKKSLASYEDSGKDEDDEVTNQRYYHYYEEALVKKKTEEGSGWMLQMRYKTDPSMKHRWGLVPHLEMKRISSPSVKTEKEKMVEILRKVANFLEHVQITNEDALVNIRKPLDNLLSALKYLPSEPFFTFLPTEIKTGIMRYLCESGAFVSASVCQEWRDLLVQERLSKLKRVRIGKHCTNKYSCESFACFMPEEILKASVTLKLDIPLEMCYPITHVDANLVSHGLMSVSDFTVNDDCKCRDDDHHSPILSGDQITDLFECLEKRSEMMRAVELYGLDTSHLDQERLVNCLLLKTKSLFLDQGRIGENPLDFEMMIQKILQGPMELLDLRLDDLEYHERHEDSAVDLADALCRVKSVRLGDAFPLRAATTQRLLQNIQVMDLSDPRSTIQALFMDTPIDWRTLMTPEELKTLTTKMKQLQVGGIFTLEQVQAVMSLPGARSLTLEQAVAEEAAGSPPAGVRVVDMTQSDFIITKIQ